MGQVINPTPPYRAAADMPEIKVRKEWYCWINPHGGEDGNIALTTSPALLGFFIWFIGLVVNILAWDGNMVHWKILARGFIMIFVYMLVWSAIFMRRREVKE